MKNAVSADHRNARASRRTAVIRNDHRELAGAILGQEHVDRSVSPSCALTSVMLTSICGTSLRDRASFLIGVACLSSRQPPRRRAACSASTSGRRTPAVPRERGEEAWPSGICTLARASGCARRAGAARAVAGSIKRARHRRSSPRQWCRCGERRARLHVPRLLFARFRRRAPEARLARRLHRWRRKPSCRPARTSRRGW